MFLRKESNTIFPETGRLPSPCGPITIPGQPCRKAHFAQKKSLLSGRQKTLFSWSRVRESIKQRSSRRSAAGKQMPTGHLHFVRFDSLCFFQKEKTPRWGAFSFLEQGTGVEPAFTAWEAVVLPIYEPCIGSIIPNKPNKCNHFFVEQNV